MLKFFSKYKTPAILIGLAFCFFAYKNYSLKSPPEVDKNLSRSSNQEHKATPGKSHHHDHHDHGDQGKGKQKKLTQIEQDKLNKLAKFSFKKEQESVLKKIQNYNENKEELISLILEPDPYLNLPIPPHTIHGLLKNQRGAFKVWTLREVAKQERQSPKLFQRILRDAKDETLRDIARTALNLIQQGSKDPLKDIANGLGDLDAIPKE